MRTLTKRGTLGGTLAAKLGFTTLAQSAPVSGQHTAVSFSSLDKGALESAPIRPEWILEGTPEAKCQSLATGTRGTTNTAHWSCTKGKFHWYFGCDETVLFLEGEVTITDQAGNVYHGQPGVSMLFPAGTSAVWEVPVYIRKIAFMHEPAPWYLHFANRIINKLSRLAGLKRLPGADALNKT